MTEELKKLAEANPNIDVEALKEMLKRSPDCTEGVHMKKVKDARD